MPLTNRDSLELASLASSDNDDNNDNDNNVDGDVNSISSRDDLSSLEFNSRGSSIEYPALLNNSSREYNDNNETNLERLSLDATLFDLGIRDFPLSASADYDSLNPRQPLEKQKRLSLFNGLSLVIGVQIGSGIFSSPGQVNSNAGSMFASLIIWTLAGLLSWTGASSYAELGSSIPLNGGSQAYLNHIYGPLLSFLFSWSNIIVLKPSSAAIVSIVSGEYLNRAIFVANSSFAPIWLNRLTAVIILIIVLLLNAISTKLSTKTSDAFLILKFLILLAIVVIGLIFLIRGLIKHNLPGAFAYSIFEDTSTSLSSYAVALYAGLWAFDGWDNVNYVAAEMKNCKRDLPRVIHIAMPTVIISYLVINISYYALLTKTQINDTNTIALVFGEVLAGSVGKITFSLCVALSCFGALNASTFTFSRLIYCASREGFVPKFFSNLNKKTNTPVNAIIFDGCLAIFYIILGDFKSLVTFAGITAYCFYFLSVLGVIILRFKEPGLERPYKVFILTPVIFCCVALFLISRGVFAAPFIALFALSFVIIGIPIYYIRSSDWSFFPLPSFLKKFNFFEKWKTMVK